jgi:hypothetical protein
MRGPGRAGLSVGWVPAGGRATVTATLVQATGPDQHFTAVPAGTVPADLYADDPMPVVTVDSYRDWFDSFHLQGEHSGAV